MFITGATGFIGKNLVKLLVAQDKYLVKCLVRKSSNVQELKVFRNVELIYQDLTRSTMKELVQILKNTEQVIHLAGVIYSKRILDYYKVNYEATTILAEAAKLAGVKKFVFVSSISAVGPRASDIVCNEDSPCYPIDAYGKSKLLAERYLINMWQKERFPVIIIRPAFVYGKGGKKGIQIYQKLLNFGVFPMVGRKGLKRSLCHVEDVAEGIILALERGKEGEVYILSEGVYTTDQIVKTLAQLTSKKVVFIRLSKSVVETILWIGNLLGKILPSFSEYQKMIYGFFKYNWAFDSTKARRELNFVPKISLIEGLKKMIN